MIIKAEWDNDLILVEMAPGEAFRLMLQLSTVEGIKPSITFPPDATETPLVYLRQELTNLIYSDFIGMNDGRGSQSPSVRHGGSPGSSGED